MQNELRLTGKMVDILNRSINPSTVVIKNGKITSVEAFEGNHDNLPFILPGFVDSHVHIESSMLIPSEFARLAVVHGTVATVSDPHEIANVCGVAGVEYMIRNAQGSPLKFYFGAPSCVPATISSVVAKCRRGASRWCCCALPSVRYRCCCAA